MTESRGVIWDFDGTLAERPGLWSGCLLEIVRAENPDDPIRREDIAALMRTGFPWHTPEQGHPELCDPDAWWDKITGLLGGVLRRLGYPDESARMMAPQVRERYLDEGVGWRLYPGVHESLRRIADAGIPQVILSNHAPELADLVERLGLAPYFQAIITSALTGYEKPHEFAYKAARAALPDGAALWMVGDSVEADVLGPARHGIQTVLLWRKQGLPPEGVERYATDLSVAADLILGDSTP
ncbi:HAD-IA family hydrolase [Planotetraspora sp. A-T 1434]|uniref:HAD family hydrolase n=1 Tax=Planotetraspora sp. A-T 1434 TaxID=2979219 RepID=UPI0021BF34E4|nr:HAD-IA family hydrolase [Planotetraspora sp. A-T 1434]MCT9935090.1 HAD-IA family hydrolase [Planotetraspora sp. A-T 1434]